jgi:putative CocE/NonD family hydrolase
MKPNTDSPRDVVEHPDMAIPLPDGTRLSARVWMPRDAATRPVPAIMEFLPYRKRDGTAARDQINHPYLASHGYACLRVDMRGCGDSQGLFDDEYSPQELQDAVDSLAWIAKQPWCSGRTAMMGISWGGFNALQVAALAPESLKAIITIGSTVDRYADDIHYKGGCMLGENAGWPAVAMSWFSTPPDPEIVGESWRGMWMERLENTPFLARTWIGHQHRDDYWRHGSVCEDYSAIKAAVLSISGWHDGYRNTVSHLVANLHAPVKGIVGPWGHKYPHLGTPGPRIGFLQEVGPVAQGHRHGCRTRPGLSCLAHGQCGARRLLRLPSGPLDRGSRLAVAARKGA